MDFSIDHNATVTQNVHYMHPWLARLVKPALPSTKLKRDAMNLGFLPQITK
jgi:hypothetical protein